MRKSIYRFTLSGLKSALLVFLLTVTGGVQAATTVLSDNPLYSASNVPANLMLALSIEFPTATVAAYKGASDYSANTSYLGYFDNTKCYSYSTTNGYFSPVNTNGPVCSGNYWSGNMLNWATMSGLDEFRQALTGGNRITDSNSNTVLLRSNLTQQGNYRGNFPDKQIGSSVNVNPSTVIGDAVLQSASNVYIRSGGMGTTFLVSNNSSFSNLGGCLVGNLTNCTNTYNAQVQVCVKGLLESNCNSAHASTDYPNAGVYNKPDGLIQQNYTKIRVGASAYAFINGNSSPNGVVRALLHDNGPTVYNGNAARTTNANTEWDPRTGIFLPNPDPVDAKGNAPGGGDATKTGAINYLNQFGSNANYETYDTVGELYWATLAYYMQVPLDSRYTQALTANNSLDVSFPFFGGTPPDPISYSCQSNAIVTIGDDHTWSDTAVPSFSKAGTLTSATGGALPVIAANGTVPEVNAYKYTTDMGNLPLIEGTNPATPNYSSYYNSANPPALGGVVWQNSGTYYLPGLAYFAHTNDIRNDVSVATTGKQTVTTYSVDVLEPGSFDGSASYPIYKPTSLSNSGPSIYWLAAKYGGFNDAAGTGVPQSFLSWHTNSTTAAANNLRPDNYFFANQPNLLQAGLTQIFNKVSTTSTQNGAGPTITPTRVLTAITPNTPPYNSPVAGFPIYNPKYTPVSWDGNLSSFVAATSVGSNVTAVSGTNTGDAQSQLDTLTQATSGASYGWDLGRRIITWNDASASGVPFRYGSLSATEKTALNGDATLLNFLRGDKSNEQTTFRIRNHILGDIVNSQAALVQGALSPSYTEKANPGYTSFTTSVVSRQPVVYIGSNDGMLHAFAADFSTPTSANPVTGAGSELFAYVPGLLYKGPNGTPQVDGLSALANLSGSNSSTYNFNFVHHFYVDRTPQVADVDFNLTGLNPTASTASTAQWHTILVGGLGKGGKGIYALDITTVPSAIDTSSSNSATTGEPALASKVLWEFTDTDMGYSYGRPLILKTRKYGWIVAITTGYDNNGSGQDGHGALYLLNAKTGALIQKIDTGVGSQASPAGLAQATGYTQDISDGTIDQIYAGDLLGNVWRFDVSETATDASGKATPSYPAPTLFATLTDPSGNPQPITTAPRIELTTDSSGLGTLRYVFVGTGQFLDTSDLSNTQQQTMYALRDGTGSTPIAAPTSTTTTGLPRSRTAKSPYNLVANTLTTPLTLTDSSAGWYYDLPGSAGNSGGTERIVIDPDAEAGLNIVTWGTTTPSSNPCALGGAIYAADFTTGVSVLTDSNGNLMKSITTSSAPTSVQIVQVNGVYTIIYGQAGFGASTAKIKQPSLNSSINQVNWREILD